MMKKVILCPNPERDKNFELTVKSCELIKKSGNAEVIVCPVLAQDKTNVNLPAEIKTGDISHHLPDADMVIAFGGDGTILHTARLAAPCGTPILGVNIGRKGFIAELERDDIELILKAISGDYEIDRRMMLDACVMRGNEKAYSGFALNDITVGGISRIIDLTVYGDGKKITSFSGDGLVVATPTGSTAYSMSAGGPIVEPTVENIILTPICAHVLVSKPFVLDAARKVTVEIGNVRGKAAYISVDGGTAIKLESSDRVEITRSGYTANLVKVSDRSFYEKVSAKLGEWR